MKKKITFQFHFNSQKKYLHSRHNAIYFENSTITVWYLYGIIDDHIVDDDDVQKKYALKNAFKLKKIKYTTF